MGRRIVLLLVPAWTACGLVSLDDLRGTGGDAASNDASADAAADGVMSDVVSTDVDAATPSPCLQTHTICEDFTSGVPGVLSPSSNGGSIGEDILNFTSSPRSAKLTTNPISGAGNAANAFLSAIPMGGSSHYLMTFAVRIPSSCFTGDPDAITIFEQWQSSYFVISLVANPDGTGTLVETSTSSSQTHALTMPLFQFDMWQHVSIDVAYGMTPPPITVNLTQGNALYSTLQKYTGVSGTVSMIVGVGVKNTAGSSPGCTVDVDDVTFDYK